MHAFLEHSQPVTLKNSNKLIQNAKQNEYFVDYFRMFYFHTLLLTKILNLTFKARAVDIISWFELLWKSTILIFSGESRKKLILIVWENNS